jgi:hypothetical protein
MSRFPLSSRIFACTFALLLSASVYTHAQVIPALGYGLAGHITNSLSKKFGKWTVNDAYPVPKGAINNALAIDLKLLFNGFFKQFFLTENPLFRLPLIQDKNTLQAKAYDTGVKWLTVLEFFELVENALEEWRKLHPEIFNSTTPSLNQTSAITPSSGSLMGVMSGLMPYSKQDINQLAASVQVDSLNFAIGLGHLALSYTIVELLCKPIGNAAQARLAVPSMNLPIAAHWPFDNIIRVTVGYLLAVFLTEPMVSAATQALSELNLYNPEMVKYNAAFYRAGNKGPFAWDGIKKLAETLASIPAVQALAAQAGTFAAIFTHNRLVARGAHLHHE